jgi:hypothetical protein
MVKWTQQKTCRVPTAPGWLLIALMLAALGFAGLAGLYPFLAVHRPVGASVLVVEGWASDAELLQAVRVFEDGGYETLAVTGCEADFAADLLPYRCYARLTWNRLLHLGVAPEKLCWVSAGAVKRDRTYHSALALKQAVGPLERLDVFSIGPHCRRTRLLFRKAFGPGVAVGVQCGTPTEYDRSDWWRCSEGVRGVLGEWLAWAYARFLFHPDLEALLPAAAGCDTETP